MSARFRRLLVAAGLTGVMLTAVLVVGGGVVSAAPPTVPVYVVRTPQQNNGRPDNLASIATRTLGNASRSGEIFSLNRGRRQADGGMLSNPADALHPGWVLRLPDDARGPDVRFGQISEDSAPSDSGYFTWKLLLSLAGAIVLGLITVLVVLRRRVRNAVRARLRRAGERRARRGEARRRWQLRGRLRREFATDRVLTERAHRGVSELEQYTVDGTVEVYAVGAGQRGLSAWVTASCPLPPPWREDTSGRWVRGDWTRSSPANPLSILRPCLVRVAGYDEDHLFVDLNWLDGVLSIGGDQAVAAKVVRRIVTELPQVRPDIRIATLSGRAAEPSGLPDWALRVDTVERLGSVTGATWSPTDDSRLAGDTVLAARQRSLAGIVVVGGPLSDVTLHQLSELCAAPGSRWAAVVLGAIDTAHWQWTADPDGALHIPALDVVATVEG